MKLRTHYLVGFVLATALAGSPVSQAQESGASCARVADDAQRLACYDSVFRAEAPAADGATVTIESERLIPAAPTGRAPAEMTVQCAEGTLVVRFSFAGHLVSATGDIAPVTFQVDQNATSVRTLSASPENTALGYWTTGESSSFLDSLSGGRNLRVRMTPVRQRSLTVDFRIDKHLEEIARVRAACG